MFKIWMPFFPWAKVILIEKCEFENAYVFLIRNLHAHMVEKISVFFANEQNRDVFWAVSYMISYIYTSEGL